MFHLTVCNCIITLLYCRIGVKILFSNFRFCPIFPHRHSKIGIWGWGKMGKNGVGHPPENIYCSTWIWSFAWKMMKICIIKCQWDSRKLLEFHLMIVGLYCSQQERLKKAADCKKNTATTSCTVFNWFDIIHWIELNYVL